MTQPVRAGSAGPRGGRESARRTALIVAGPTTAGKSALALAIAERFGGTVINADAMQCYRELRVITARPSPEEEARAPHALYGVLAAARAGHVAWWREAALAEMARARLPILCGGTGMYLRALTQGISALPEVSAAAREEARALLGELGPGGLHAKLHPEDSALRPSDSQRIARAYEVWRSSGRSLASWQRAAPVLPAAPYRFRAILLDPPRGALREAIVARWAAMMAGGAVAEVAALLEQHLDPALPAMRAHGVPEVAAMLRGEIDEAEASRRAIAHTAAYTKRQATWFRHQALAEPQGTHRINARIAGHEQFSERNISDLFAFLYEAVDAAQHGP
ncbi:tRNA (adenosine(37)-N6)-dimethylallyltransferase MiaA [Roseococcus sp. SYP-B2431]|uniref:tRNA (adenosine(37)-N6)-dimethylallyltransferase MiaA n=1 Tax=Roseococcus sp. SYP-B2431 TaxID=2496640 RepID=UPI00103EEC6A|nr:tRNA (adenosine(37)-N6)-dimethylallyltransferase MiaA [Roseococcus sp. SYP-B2431]TCI00086.1 tRNA (adenosine(37)-N6)-dimethylallyltransferase MiaA [Roseococcus sp. SYP-B2431]